MVLGDSRTEDFQALTQMQRSAILVRPIWDPDSYPTTRLRLEYRNMHDLHESPKRSKIGSSTSHRRIPAYISLGLEVIPGDKGRNCSRRGGRPPKCQDLQYMD
ncbi:hypothetical protein N7456_000298 [Penicillium angulare]|uniref:Uncharacterized protein n=1 Tax=Penicillium angulare TaxID=116970 RepID=A0A9W9GC65_9EURO|nr:hypothetical protein N7456_000298 [Penicillium angulare]